MELILESTGEPTRLVRGDVIEIRAYGSVPGVMVFHRLHNPFQPLPEQSPLTLPPTHRILVRARVGVVDRSWPSGDVRMLEGHLTQVMGLIAATAGLRARYVGSAVKTHLYQLEGREQWPEVLFQKVQDIDFGGDRTQERIYSACETVGFSCLAHLVLALRSPSNRSIWVRRVEPQRFIPVLFYPSLLNDPAVQELELSHFGLGCARRLSQTLERLHIDQHLDLRAFPWERCPIITN